jgi:peroxiredoxin
MPYLLPRHPTPALRLPLSGGGTYELGLEKPREFTMLVFYRGLHCPICKMQIHELETKLNEFAKRGIDVVAISTDDQAKADRTKSEWGLPALKVAYDLKLDEARKWGLFVSAGKPGSNEPALFTEPAIFLIRPDRTLYFASVQTMPFARPRLADILSAIDFVQAENYPARGEVPPAG